MKMPSPTPDAVRLLEGLVEGDDRLEVRKLFGQPAAFVRGNLCLGVFGGDVFARLSEADRARAQKLRGVRPFEPMPGRPMSGYLVLPKDTWKSPKARRDWVERAVQHTLTLPPKKSARVR
jgi:TfoX/Sxy family transcriptional regulator of competence genes